MPETLYYLKHWEWRDQSEWKEEQYKKHQSLTLEDITKLYLNPKYVPPFDVGMVCRWNGMGEDHSPECNGRVHETLAKVCTAATSMKLSRKQRAELENAFTALRKSLVEAGIKIP